MEVDLQREGRINVTPKRIQSRPIKLKNEERNSLAQALNNKRIAGNIVTNFLDDINTSNEESIDEGHAPSWVLEKSAKNIADKALSSGNKNWLDMIGKVETYGGGNYAQTQKGRKIIRDTITLIDNAANTRETKEYQKRTRVRADLKEEFTIGFNRVLGMPDGEEKEALIKIAKADAFNKGISNIYQSVYNNYDLINKREGLPVILDDKEMIPKALEWINQPGNFGTPEAMAAGFTTFLAERNIQVGENQQSKIDKLFKAYTPLEGINEYNELDESIDKFGEDIIKELGVNAKWVPAEVRPVVANQKLVLIREFRQILNQHRQDIKDDPDNKQQQFIPYGAWSADQKDKLYKELTVAKEGFFTNVEEAIKSVWDANKPDAKDAGTNDAWNKKYETLGNYVDRQRLGGVHSLSKKEEEVLKNLKAEMKARWPQKWEEYEEAVRKGEGTHREVISFGEGADPKDTTAIRGILAEHAFESPEYLQMELNKYLNKGTAKGSKGKVLDTVAQAEVDLFKSGMGKLKDVPAVKKSLTLLDSIISTTFPGWQAGLLSLNNMEIVKKVPSLSLEAVFKIRDAREDIEDAIKAKLKTIILGEGDRPGLRVPYGPLWSDQQREDFNKEARKEIEKEFLSGGFREGEPMSDLIKELKALSPDGDTGDTPAQKIEKIGGRIIEGFPQYLNKDISGKIEEIIGLVDGITDNGVMKELYRKILPEEVIPNSIKDKRTEILKEVAKYYRLLSTSLKKNN